MGRPDGEIVMLLPIGKFSRVSRLSIKSLRNYDESGLLPAAFVDPQSGYRYYRLEQLARADAIRSLRMVSMPLPQIAEVLDDGNPEELLMSHLAELEHQRDALNHKAHQLQKRIKLKEFTMSTDIVVKTNQPLTAIGYRTETTFDQIFNDIPTGFGAVIAALTETGVDPAGVPFTLYHQAPDGDTTGDITMCVPVADGTVSVSDDTTLVTLPAGVAASIVHRGSYENMGETYASVAGWIQERGHHIVGPAREVYLNSPAEVPEAELLTEILFPIDAEGEQ